MYNAGRGSIKLGIPSRRYIVEFVVRSKVKGRGTEKREAMVTTAFYFKM